MITEFWKNSGSFLFGYCFGMVRIICIYVICYFSVVLKWGDKTLEFSSWFVIKV